MKQYRIDRQYQNETFNKAMDNLQIAERTLQWNCNTIRLLHDSNMQKYNGKEKAGVYKSVSVHKRLTRQQKRKLGLFLSK